MINDDELRRSTLEAADDARQFAHEDPNDAEAPEVEDADPFTLLAKGYDDLCARSPDDIEAHFQFGRQFLQVRMLDRAIAALGRAVQLAPKWPEARYFYGAALKEANRLEEALREFDETVKLDATIFEARYERKLLRLKLKKGDGGDGHAV